MAIIASGLTDDFNVFAALRVFFGVVCAVNAPASLSLIRDLFMDNQRSKANALFSASIYWGSGVGGLGNFIIDMAGWRYTYVICGGSGILIGILGLLLLKEPQRGQYDFVTCEDEMDFDPVKIGIVDKSSSSVMSFTSVNLES